MPYRHLRIILFYLQKLNVCEMRIKDLRYYSFFPIWAMWKNFCMFTSLTKLSKGRYFLCALIWSFFWNCYFRFGDRTILFGNSAQLFRIILFYLQNASNFLGDDLLLHFSLLLRYFFCKFTMSSVEGYSFLSFSIPFIANICIFWWPLTCYTSDDPKFRMVLSPFFVDMCTIYALWGTVLKLGTIRELWGTINFRQRALWDFAYFGCHGNQNICNWNISRRPTKCRH